MASVRGYHPHPKMRGGRRRGAKGEASYNVAGIADRLPEGTEEARRFN